MKNYLAVIVTGVALLTLSGCKQEISNYESSWEHRAHQLQRELDADRPLTQTTFFGTHNSYNASSYTTAQSYLDPNQTHSLTSQLRMDIRALELDVHSFNVYDNATKTWGIDLLLCHGLGNHVGCSPWDRPFVTGLQEIADWIALPENRNEVLLVYIEDHINSDHYPMAMDAMESTIAPYVFMPENAGCNRIPESMTKNRVRDAGKNIILISDGCNNSSFNVFVYGGFENGPSGYPTAGVEDLNAAPECLQDRYTPEQMDSLFVRMQEDRTILSNLVGAAGPKVTPEVIANMLSCSINLLGMDKLRPFDGRLRAGIWSWADGEPSQSPEKQCAQHTANGRFEAADCGQTLPFACRDNITGEWFISATTGTWQEGFNACASANMAFTVPYSASDNQQLTHWQTTLGMDNVWLGYGTNGGMNWQAF